MDCGCLTKEVIDISGLCNINSLNLAAPNNVWTEIIVAESLVIPIEKPDIEQINAVNISTNIVRQKVVVTPTSPKDAAGNLIPNFEGKTLTGRKLIVEGELCQTVTYTANVCSQTVHSAHFVVPFSAYLVIPGANSAGIDSLKLNFQVNACIEDVFIKEFSPRHIFKNVILLLQAVPAPFGFCPNECPTL